MSALLAEADWAFQFGAGRLCLVIHLGPDRQETAEFQPASVTEAITATAGPFADLQLPGCKTVVAAIPKGTPRIAPTAQKAAVSTHSDAHRKPSFIHLN